MVSATPPGVPSTFSTLEKSKRRAIQASTGAAPRRCPLPLADLQGGRHLGGGDPGDTLDPQEHDAAVLQMGIVHRVGGLGAVDEKRTRKGRNPAG